MIVLTQNYILGLGENQSPNAPVIGYHSVVTINNISASGGQTGANLITNLANPATNLLWESGSALDQYLTVTAVEQQIDYVGIAGHNWGGKGFLITIEADLGAGFVQVTDKIMPADNAPIMFLLGTVAPDDIRIKIETDGVTHPIAAVLKVGRCLRMQRNIYVGHAPMSLNRRLRVNNNRSESGNFLGRLVTGRTSETAVTMHNITAQWMRTHFDPFVLAVEEDAFFWGWRPFDYPFEIGYAWLTDDPQPSNEQANGMMQVSFSMQGIVK